MTDLATAHRALADTIEQLDAAIDGVEIDDATLLERSEDHVRAQVTIATPVATGNNSTEIQTSSEPEHVDEDVAVDDAECDVAGCDYTGSERGLAIHMGRTHPEHEETGSADEAVDTAPDDDLLVCEKCSETFDSEHGLNIHRGHKHDGGDELSEGIDEETGLTVTSPDTRDIGTGELTSAVRPLNESEVVAEKTTEDTNGLTAPSDSTSESDGSDFETKDFAGDEEDSDNQRTHYPWVCSCGVVCDDSLQEAIHRTEAHDSRQTAFNLLEPGEFEQHVEAADTVSELADELDWSTEKVLRTLGIYGFEGALTGDGLPDDPTAACDLLTTGSGRPEVAE